MDSLRDCLRERRRERLRWLAVLSLVGVLPLVYWGRFADCFPLPKLLFISALGIPAVLLAKDLRVPSSLIWIWPWTGWILGCALLGRAVPSLWRSLPEAALLVIPVWVAASAALSPRRIREAAGICVAAGGLVAAIGVMQLAGLADEGWLSPFHKGIASTIGNPDLLGGFLLIPFAIGLAGCLRGDAVRTWFPATLLMGAAILGTESRAAWLGALTAAAPLFLVLRRNGLIWLAGALLVMASLLAALPAARARMLSLSALQERLWTWRHAAHAVRGNPIAGWGTGSFRTVYLNEQTKTHRNGEDYYHYTEYAHLEPLHVWAELGTLGLGLLIWGIAACLRMWRRSRLKEIQYGLWLGIGAGSLAFLLNGLLSFPLHVAPAAVHFWFMLAACSVGRIRQEGGIPAGRNGPSLLPWALALLVMPPALRIAYANIALREGQVFGRAGAAAAAEEVYAAAARLLPDDVRLNWHFASLKRQRGDFRAAELLLARALELEPDFYELHHERGMVMKDLGRYAAAEDSYLRALEINPGFGHSWNNLGNLLGEQGRLADAERAQRRALALFPDSVEARRNLAVTLIRQGREEEAEQVLKGGKW